jgi:hypothetical protein
VLSLEASSGFRFFNFSGFVAGPFTFTLWLPSPAVPVAVFPGDFPNEPEFRLPPVPGVFTQGGRTHEFVGRFSAYGSDPGRGGFWYSSFDRLLNVRSPQIFTGPLSAPVFRPGDYTVTVNEGMGTVNEPMGKLTGFTISTVPEPASLALVAAGGLVVAGVAVARKRAASGA